jgi:hypothetical protein
MVPGGDRFAIVAAYYLVASERHSGQWSTGYRKLSQCCRLGFRPGLGNLRDDEQIREHAAALLWKRRREIRKHW